MAEISEHLIAAYRAARYEIDPPRAATIATRIGEANPALDALLARLGVREAAFLTAYNPASFRLCEAENEAAQENLVRELRARARSYLPARGVDPAGAWPDEPGVLVLAITRDQAAALARQFDQNGFVYYAAGKAPELVLATDRTRSRPSD